jgi:hypothetical protein
MPTRRFTLRPRPAFSRHGARRRLRFELLENRRVLAPLVGVELGLGPAPANWNSVTSVGIDTNPTFVENLIDESGAATDIDFQIYGTHENGGENVDTTINPEVLPQHTQSLANIDNSVQIDSEVGVHSFVATWKGLVPERVYEIYVFAAESTINYADNQQVTILGSEEDENDVFQQAPSFFDGNLWINGTTSSNSQPLSNYKILKPAHETGEIAIIATMMIDSDVVILTALAIRDTTEPPPPISADFNMDETVDGLDYLAWQRGFGITENAARSDGNADNDEDVDADDLVVWQNAFGPAVAAAQPLMAAATSAASAPTLTAAVPSQSQLTPETADAALTLIAASRPATTPRVIRPQLNVAPPAGAALTSPLTTVSATSTYFDGGAVEPAPEEAASHYDESLDLAIASLGLASERGA